MRISIFNRPAIAAALFIGSACPAATADLQAMRPETTGPGPRQAFKVLHVVDGNSVVLLAGPGRPITVRLLGVGRPKGISQGAYDWAASRFLRDVLNGREVYLSRLATPSGER